jgi:thioredoxin reductase
VIASRANGETNARGCFVAGDTLTANNLKTVAVALSTGMWKKSKDIFFS